MSSKQTSTIGGLAFQFLYRRFMLLSVLSPAGLSQILDGFNRNDLSKNAAFRLLTKGTRNPPRHRARYQLKPDTKCFFAQLYNTTSSRSEKSVLFSNLRWLEKIYAIEKRKTPCRRIEFCNRSEFGRGFMKERATACATRQLKTTLANRQILYFRRRQDMSLLMNSALC